MRPSPKCLLTGWIAGWVVAVFLPGLIFALRDGVAWAALPGQVWEAGDAISPWAKLSLGALMGLSWTAVARLSATQAVKLTLSALAGALSAALVVAALPQAWSAGFGVGLTGARFETRAAPVYLVAAALAGLVHAVTFARCDRRRSRSA